MQQRRVRLGDILDDYCPRERRITNHAVVAMIEDEVKQTRCTTCDADHEYKQAKVPASRRKKPTGALAGSADAPALASPPLESSDDAAAVEAAATVGDAVEASFDAPVEPFVSASEPSSLEAAPPVPDASQAEADENGATPEDEWPVHRPLIRAVLPRPEGQVPERKEPDFTIRNNRFDRNGNRPRGDRGRGPGSHSRFNQSPSGSGPSHRSGHGQGAGPHSGHGSRPGNRPPSGGQRGGGRPGGGGGQGRGPNAGQGRGRRGR